jgi:hypothetical protein
MSFARQTVNSAINIASGTTLDSAAFNAVTGRLIVVEVGWESTDTTVSISDTAGNTYTPLTKRKHSVDANWVQAFYCLSCSGNVSNVVRATHASAADYRGMDVASYSYDGTCSFDKEGTGECTAAVLLTMASIAPTGTSSNLLITAGKSFNNRTYTAFDGNWTMISDGTSGYHWMQERVQTGTSSLDGGVNASTSADIVGVYAIFKESIAGIPVAWWRA